MSVIKTGTTSTTGYIVESDTNGNLVIQTGSTPTTALTLNSNQTATFAQFVNIPNTFGFKNRIINGGMVIDQRNAGASITVNNTNLNYSVDRWWGTGKTSDGVYTMQRSTSTPPTGFSNFLRVTVTTADASIAAGDTYYMGTKIEGFNVADLGFGSANAQTITISFWARSSVTGTFSGALLNGAENRSYPFTFAINTANTWEYETITIAGDTTGTWATDNTAGMVLTFDLGNGSNWRATAGSWVAAGEYGATGAVTLISTLNATFDITGVQLERGSTATSFDFRPYGTELMLCQRYLPAFPVTAVNWRLPAVGLASGGNTFWLTLTFPVTTRVPPTGMVVSAAGHWAVGADGLVSQTALNTFTFGTLASNNAARITGTTATSPFTTGQVVAVDSASASANLYFTGCEL